MLMRIIEYSSRWHHETFSSATVYENICYLLIVYAGNDRIIVWKDYLADWGQLFLTIITIAYYKVLFVCTI